MEDKNKDEEELFIPKTKHKGLKIFIGILLIGGLITGGYFLYQYKFNNPKTIVDKLLADAKENVKKNLVNDVGNDLYKIDGHIKIDANIDNNTDETINILKDVEVQFNGEVDPTNSIGNLNINTKYKNDKLIDFKTYYEKNNVYLLLDGIYDKYLKVDTNGEQKGDIATAVPKIEINTKDMQTLANSIINALQKEVNKLELKKESTTITIDGKKMDVFNNYVELKDKEVNTFIKNIISYLEVDKDFTETLKKLTDKDSKTILSEAIQGINEETFQGTYRINFYTDKAIFNKKLISIRQEITQSGITLSYNVDKISDDEIKIGISMMGVEYSIKVKKNNTTINLVLNMNAMGSYVNVELNINYEKIKEITKPDLSNSKDINSLTEAENEEISNKLAKNENILKLMRKINGTSVSEA